MALNNLLGLFPNNGPQKLLGGRYEVISKLGSGGFGQTFLACDVHLPDRPQCVIKQLKPQVSSPKFLATARRLFDTEARVLYKLGSHEQIPHLLAHFEENQEFYLAQEYVEGEQLTQELISGQLCPESQVFALLKDILQVLSFVHEQNVIHRDIKPANLIRRRDGKIVLIDFGAVKQVSTQFAGVMDLTIAIGTQGYVATEQMGGNPRFSSDVYAVGIIGIQALTGRHPLQLGEDVDTGEIIWHDLVPDINKELADVIDCMVRYDFRSRYPTAKEALVALNKIDLPIPQPQKLTGGENQAALDPAEMETQIDFAVPVVKQPLISSSTSTTLKQNPPQLISPRQGKQPLNLVSGKILKPATIAIAALIGITFGANKLLISQPQVSEPPGNKAPAPPTPTPEQKAQELIKKAENLRQAEDYRQAAATYEQAIALQPDIASAHWGLCYSRNQQLQYQKAISACDAALSLNPDYPEALWSKGAALKELGNFEPALALYNQALQLKPNFTEVWINKGTVLHDMGRYQESLGAYDQALRLESSSADAWANRGAALWALKRFDDAIASLEKALAIDPNHFNANDLRQQARRKIGR